jgi:hypothetical protein
MKAVVGMAPWYEMQGHCGTYADQVLAGHHGKAVLVA